MVVWSEVDTVFLDMDGTLLDLHFDNYFWQCYVPQCYARDKNINDEEAQIELALRYKEVEGRLEWYCLDHWSRELGLDIALLKEEVDHLMAVHPHVTDFLAALRASGRRIVLVTNAHQKALALKLNRTQLGGCFDAIYCAHDIGLPKENPQFWHELQQLEPFDPKCTLFVDDSLSVLRSARQYGFRWLLAVVKPDSHSSVRKVTDFPAIHDFSEIISGLAENKLQ